jgi:hypothetical protein
VVNSPDYESVRQDALQLVGGKCANRGQGLISVLGRFGGQFGGHGVCLSNMKGASGK